MPVSSAMRWQRHSRSREFRPDGPQIALFSLTPRSGTRKRSILLQGRRKMSVNDDPPLTNAPGNHEEGGTLSLPGAGAAREDMTLSRPGGGVPEGTLSHPGPNAADPSHTLSHPGIN